MSNSLKEFDIIGNLFIDFYLSSLPFIKSASIMSLI